MTDISDIADAIIQLINSQMRSPTKQEIEAVVLKHLEPRCPKHVNGVTCPDCDPSVPTSGPDPKDWVQVPADCGHVFSLLGPATHVAIWNDDTQTMTVEPLDFLCVTDEVLEVAADEICAQEVQDAWIAEIANYDLRVGLMPLPDKLLSTEIMEGMAQIRARVDETFKSLYGDFNPLEGFKRLSNPVGSALDNGNHLRRQAHGVPMMGSHIVYSDDPPAAGLDHPAKNCDRDGHQFSVRDVCDRCGTTLLEMLGQNPRI